MKRGQWRFFWFLALLGLFSVSPALARDWNTTDSDLPAQLKGLSQAQLNVINKVNELNPAFPDKFNPRLLDLFIQDTQQPPVVRTGHDSTALPPVNPQFAQDIGGNPTGTGLGPSPSDGPVSHLTPGPNPNRQTSGGNRSFNPFFGPFPPSSDEEDFWNFWNYMSGSGGFFGDCVGADCIPHLGFPGEPLGGPPWGSWVQFDRSHANFRFASDAALLNDVRAGNFSGAASSIQSTLGQEVRHDPRGKGF